MVRPCFLSPVCLFLLPFFLPLFSSRPGQQTEEGPGVGAGAGIGLGISCNRRHHLSCPLHRPTSGRCHPELSSTVPATKSSPPWTSTWSWLAIPCQVKAHPSQAQTSCPGPGVWPRERAALIPELQAPHLQRDQLGPELRAGAQHGLSPKRGGLRPPSESRRGLRGEGGSHSNPLLPEAYDPSCAQGTSLSLLPLPESLGDSGRGGSG